MVKDVKDSKKQTSNTASSVITCDNEGVDGGTEITSERSGEIETKWVKDWKGKDVDERAANLNIKKAAERTTNWEEQVLDGPMEGRNSDGKKCA